MVLPCPTRGRGHGHDICSTWSDLAQKADKQDTLVLQFRDSISLVEEPTVAGSKLVVRVWKKTVEVEKTSRYFRFSLKLRSRVAGNVTSN
jgi:hypothetical protein